MKYIQFVGTQRSGSNLLRVMLNQEPEISAPHPPHILKTFYPILHHYGDLEIKSNFYQLTVDVCDWVKKNPVPWEHVNLDPEKICKECRRNTLVDLFSTIYEQKAVVDKASIWCCKSMENVYYAAAIEEHGLRPFYIYLYRDGRDVALSFKKAIVGPKHIYHLADKWRKEQALAIQLINTLPKERYAMVCYEELIANPEKELRSICEKIEIPFRPEILDYFHSHESQITASSGDMWRNLTQPIIKTNSNKFKKELTEEEIWIFESVAGKTLEYFGYSLESKVDYQSFTTAEIDTFSIKNQEIINQVQLQANDDERNRRRPQEELLSEIIARTVTQHSN